MPLRRLGRRPREGIGPPKQCVRLLGFVARQHLVTGYEMRVALPENLRNIADSLGVVFEARVQLVGWPGLVTSAGGTHMVRAMTKCALLDRVDNQHPLSITRAEERLAAPGSGAQTAFA